MLNVVCAIISVHVYAGLVLVVVVCVLATSQPAAAKGLWRGARAGKRG